MRPLLPPDQEPRPRCALVWDPAQLLAHLESGRSLEEVLYALVQQAQGALQVAPIWLGATIHAAMPMISFATAGFPQDLSQALESLDRTQLEKAFPGQGQSEMSSLGVLADLAATAEGHGFRYWAWTTCAGRNTEASATLLAFTAAPPFPPFVLDTLASLASFALRLVQEASSPLGNMHWQELARHVFRALPEPALLLDALDGRVLDVNQAACRLYGYPPVDFRTKRLSELASPVLPAGFRRRMHVRADGTPIAVEVTSTPFLEGPHPMALMLVRDATLDYQMEEALRESEARYRGLFESALASIWEEDFSEVKTYLEGLGLAAKDDLASYLEAHPHDRKACLDRIHVRNTNLKTLELFGCGSQSNLVGHLSCLSDQGACKILAGELSAFRSGQLTFETELRTTAGRDEPRDIVLVARLAPGADTDWSQVLVSIVDITDRTRAMEEVRRNRANLSEAQSMAEMGSCEVDVRTGEVDWSMGALRLLKVSPGQAMPTIHRILGHIPSEDRSAIFHALREMLRHGAPMDVEVRISAPEEGVRHIALKVRAERNDEGRPLQLVAVFQDITRRKQMEASLRESEAGYRRLAEENAILLARFRQEAEEKSMLLQEVNHRVKNNLTSILGMLDMELQASLRTGSEAVHSFEDLKQRIYALSSVHELLSAAEWSPLRLESFATDLIRNSLAGSTVSHGVRVDVSPSREAVWVNPSSATALAMILAELTTNSVKYAFERRGAGRITLRIRSLKDARNRVCLTYQDDGPGYPEDVLEGARENVGLKLIRLNVKTLLRGELTLDNQRGARVRIAFQPMPLSRTSTRWSEP